MFVVPNYQPAIELYGSLEMTQYTNLETTATPEQRLQLLGIKNSVIKEKFTVKTSCETSNPNKRITLMMDPFESIGFEQKLRKNDVKESKRSIRSWLWQQYLSRHGNCSLCERPLNGLYEDVVMLTCAHALHSECAQEMHQNRNGCQRCEIGYSKLHHLKCNEETNRKNCLCCCC